MECPKAGSTGWSAFASWRSARIGRRQSDERLLRCRRRPENADVGAKSPRDFRMGPAERHPGARAQVSRLPGSARDALDRTGPVVFSCNLPALGAAFSLRRRIALLVCGTYESHKGQL